MQMKVMQNPSGLSSLITDDATNLGKGMNLRYLGLDVGQIDSIQLDAKSETHLQKP